MTLDIDDPSFDLSELNSSTYMCVVNKFGDIKVKNLLYNCVSDMGAVTLDPFALGTQTLEAGDYVCVGENVVNKSELPTICEGYLIKHMVYEAKYGDSSSWTPAAVQDMQAYFAKLSNTFATLSDDITDVPITNLDYIGW
ncbi:MAG TPA: hypothetical protein DCE71_00235 [Parachlamydiales bacterium]|nr:hypothetical protein [Parachlamydiales bacterium]